MIIGDDASRGDDDELPAASLVYFGAGRSKFRALATSSFWSEVSHFEPATDATEASRYFDSIGCKRYKPSTYGGVSLSSLLHDDMRIPNKSP